MILITHILFVLAYGLGAILAGFTLPRLWPDLGASESFTAAGLMFVLAALTHEILVRSRHDRELARALSAARRVEASLVADLDVAQHEMARLRGNLQSAEDSTQKRIDVEIGVVKKLLTQVARHIEGARPGAVAARSSITPKIANQPPPIPSEAGDRSNLASLVRAAIEDNRFDLYLQPIVSLPQRKVRYYEAFSRLRDDNGNVLTPDRFLGVAENTGLITTIDNMQLFRCVHLIRKLKRRNKQIGFFCNLSVRTLQDEEFFAQFADFLSGQDDLPDSVIFEFAATELARAKPEVKQRLARLAGMGFSLSLDQVPSLDIDVVDLARRGFRFVKIDAAQFISASDQGRTDIAVTDLKEAFRRHGVDLIAEKVETEATVVNLLEHDVDFGQGYLFGEPRQSREAA